MMLVLILKDLRCGEDVMVFFISHLPENCADWSSDTEQFDF